MVRWRVNRPNASGCSVPDPGRSELDVHLIERFWAYHFPIDTESCAVPGRLE